MAWAAATSIVVGDLARAGVEQAAEDAGERQHVVDLVRVVADRPVATTAACCAAVDRVDLGVGVGQCEDDRAVGHRRDVVAGEQVRRGHPDEHVGARQDLVQACRYALGLVCSAIQRRDSSVVRLAARAPHPCGRERDDVAGALREQQPDDRAARPRRPRTPRSATSRQRLADHPQRVRQGGQDDDRRAVLVVVEDRDVEHLAQPASISKQRGAAMSSRLIPP